MCLYSSSLCESFHVISYIYLSYKILVVLSFYILTAFVSYDEAKFLSLLFHGASEHYSLLC